MKQWYVGAGNALDGEALLASFAILRSKYHIHLETMLFRVLDLENCLCYGWL